MFEADIDESSLLFRLGETLGAVWAPVVAGVSAIRQARMFHPSGVVYRGRVTVATTTPWPDVAARLSGHVLVRLSSAWWKRREWPDVLGVALRFTRRAEVSADATADDQDLLFATARSPWTLPLAPLSTAVHDFFANDYYAVAPFAVDGIGEGRLRIVPAIPIDRASSPSSSSSRRAKLAQAVAQGTARWQLEVKANEGHDWSPLAEIALTTNVTEQIDQKRLRFSPFRAARGFSPIGFVQGLRRATYIASQEARPHGEAKSVPRAPLHA